MTDVRLSAGAVKDLDHMIAALSLPFDTRERVRRKLEPLEHFPRLGRQLEGRWYPLRLTFGPWPWMLILYSYEEDDDLVLVVGFQDGRSSTAAGTSRALVKQAEAGRQAQELFELRAEIERLEQKLRPGTE